jgi:hypothetical protein
MLIRDDKLGSPELIFNTAMNTVPTVQRSVYDSLYAGVATPFAVTNQLLNSEYAKKPRGRAMFDKLEAINLERQTPGMGWGQWLADEGANMLGYSLNPATWALGAAGGAVARTGGAAAARGLSAVLPDAATIFMRKPLNELLAQPISKFLPTKVGKEGAERTLSSGLLTDKTISTFGTFAGAGVPQGVYDNFNRKTGNINWGGVARESAEMGAFGVAIGTIPFAWGVLRGKVNRSMGRGASDVVDNRALDTALERGHITSEEHQWYSDYLAHQKEPHNEEMTRSLQERGSHIANANGHKANTVTNEATFDFLTGDDVNNLQGVVADQLASAHLPETQRMALSNYIIHNRMDFFRKDPKSLDGLRGYVDFVNQKLKDKPSQIKEANRILDEHLMTSVKENMPFSQKELFKMMKKSGFESSHIAHLPVTIPENMANHLKLSGRINELKQKLRKATRRGEPENKQTLRRIEELESKLPKILTPKEELAQLRKALLTDKGLSVNWQRSNAYHRLLDLSSVWKNAETLLDRVHLEHEYNRQESFKKVSDTVLRNSESEMPTFARPENVVDYLKARIEQGISKIEPIEDLNRAVEAKESIPGDYESVLGEQEAQTQKVNAEAAKNELIGATEKFKEFKKSENVFKNLISCVMGGISG